MINMAILKERSMIIDRIEVVHKNKDGKIISKRVLNNSRFHRFLVRMGLAHDSITTNGMAACAGLIGNTGSVTSFQYVGIGTGTVAAASTDVWMGSGTCVGSATSISRVTTTVANDTLQLVFTFGSTGGQGSLTATAVAVTEVIAANGTGAATYSASGSNICLLRQVYTPADTCNFGQGDTLTITIKVQAKQGA